MRKLIVTVACLLAMAGAACAQSIVEWSVIPVSGFSVQTNTTVTSVIDGSIPLSGGTVGFTTTTPGSFYYELVYYPGSTQQSAPATLADLDDWLDTGLEAETYTNIVGRATPINGSVFASVPFTSATSVMMVGWSANLGTNWSAASATLNSPSALASVVGTPLFGESSTGFITPNTADGDLVPGASVFGTQPGEIDSMDTPLEPVTTPEPAALALGAVGTTSLLAFRRRRA